MKKEFEKPELIIVLFEDELATDPIPASGDLEDPWSGGDKN